MRFLSLAQSVLAVAALGIAAVKPAAAADAATRLSGPHVHDNLAVYFVHGPSAAGPVPLTLAEALATGSVKVVETGNVNALQVENLGTQDVFIQSGDIVKGGQQDRVLTVSLLLPSKSGSVSIDSFCVEQGRWAARGKEDVKSFASAAEALPSREAKLAMKLPPKELAIAAAPPPTGTAVAGQLRTQNIARNGPASDTSIKQRKVWDEVANIQAGLERRLGAKVAAPQSATSLQLSLENAELKAARAAYIKALEDKTAGQTDIVGFVFAIDGRINSADVYPSAGLFQKMWGKLLAASVTEAIGVRAKSPTASVPPATIAAPVVADVETFLKNAETGKVHQATIAKLMTQETRDAEASLYVEAKRSNGAWVHRNYLAK